MKKILRRCGVEVKRVSIWESSNLHAKVGAVSRHTNAQDLELAFVLYPADEALKKDLVEMRALAKNDHPRRRRIPIEEVGQIDNAKESVKTKSSSTKSMHIEVVEALQDETGISQNSLSAVRESETTEPVCQEKPATMPSIPIEKDSIDSAAPSKKGMPKRTTPPAPPKSGLEFERDWKQIRGDLSTLFDYLQVP
jgi:hypothetical protein